MNKLPSERVIECLRLDYPKGTRVELIEMNDPYTRLNPSEKGTVNFIDDTGTIFVDWDCGSGLGIVYGVDKIRKI